MAGFYKDGKPLTNTNSQKKKKGFTVIHNDKTANDLEYDGIKFGTVTDMGLKAIKTNTLDSYTPENEEEKKAIEAYKNHLKNKLGIVSGTERRTKYHYGDGVRPPFDPITDKREEKNTINGKADTTDKSASPDLDSQYDFATTYANTNPADKSFEAMSDNEAKLPSPFESVGIDNAYSTLKPKTTDIVVKDDKGNKVAITPKDAWVSLPTYVVEAEKWQKEYDSQLSQRFAGLSYNEVQKEKEKYAPDSEEYKYLDSYTAYVNLNDLDKALEIYDKVAEFEENIATYDKRGTAFKKRSTGLETDGGNGAKAREEKAKLQKFLSSVGYTYEEFKKERKEKKEYYDNLVKTRNVLSIDRAFDRYEHYMKRDDFAEKSKYVKLDDQEYRDAFWKGSTYVYINDEDYRNFVNLLNGSTGGNGTDEDKKGYDRLRPEEIAVYNYIYKTEGEDKAQEFLDAMEITLTKRDTIKREEQAKNIADTPVGAVALSIASVPQNVIGSVIGFGGDVVNTIKGKEYNPYAHYKAPSNTASAVRQQVSENIANATDGMELLGQNIPSFLYQTGMSIADSAVGTMTLNKAYAPFMGYSAFQQKAREMIEAGESEDVVFGTAMVSGVAEALFEYVGIDNLLKIKGVDSLRTLVVNTLKQMGIEASGEMATEITNILADTLIRGDTSELSKKYTNLINQGYSEKDARIEIAKQVAGQVGWAGAGGAISGGSMGGASSVFDFNTNLKTGSNIRTESQVKELLSIMQNLPKESSAYKVFNEYADSGVNADNISDAQLGNLYNTAKSEAYNTAVSKKATAEQKFNAYQTWQKLDALVPDTVETESKENNTTPTTQDETANTETTPTVVEPSTLSQGKVSDKTVKEIKYPKYTEEDFIINSKKLITMQSVKDLTGNEFKKEGDTKLKDKVMAFFNRLGNKIHSERFGDVDLTLSSFRSEAAHGWTKGKIVSFEAIPEVVRNGVVIDSQNRGNGNYDRIVVAAPITISGEEYYMGVMLQRDHKSQRLYLHDVITKEKASLSDSENLSSNRVADESDNLFMTSILQKAVLVNSQYMQNKDTIYASPVNIGDAFTDTKNGDTIKVVRRDETATTMEFTDKDGNVATTTLRNSVADAMNTNPRYVKTEAVSNRNVGDTSAKGSSQPKSDAQTDSAVKIGDTFVVNNSTGSIIKVVGRDDKSTTVEVTYKNGNTKTMNYTNERADQMKTSSKFSQIDNSSVAPKSENLSAENAISEVTPKQNVIFAESSSGVLNNQNKGDIIEPTEVGAGELTEKDDVYDILDRIGLTEDEKYAISEYKSSGSYTLNYFLREGITLSDEQAKLKEDLITALNKFPVFKGTVYRNIGFSEKEDFDNFVSEHKSKSTVTYPAFTSASKSTTGYTVDDLPYTVHYDIECMYACDVAEIGIVGEQEVLFKAGSKFEIIGIEANGNSVSIKCKEVAGNGNIENELHTSNKEGRNEQKTEENVGRKTDFGSDDENSGQVGNVRRRSTPSNETSGRTTEYNRSEVNGNVLENSDELRTEAGNELYAQRELHNELGEVSDNAENNTPGHTQKTNKEEVNNGRGKEIPDTESTGGKNISGEERGSPESIRGKIKKILHKYNVNRTQSGHDENGSGRVEQKETSEDFANRVQDEGYEFRIINQTSVAFKLSTESKWNKNAKEAAEILESLGLTVIVFEGDFLSNRKGVTENSSEALTCGTGDYTTIFVSDNLSIDGMEIAYHEAFHALRRMNKGVKHHHKMIDIISDGVDIESESFEKFVSAIAKLYSYNVKKISPDNFSDQVIEEFYAWYIGSVYANKNEQSVDMLAYIKDFSAVDSIKPQLDAVYAKVKAEAKAPTKEEVLYEATDRYNNDEQGTGINFSEMFVPQGSEESRQNVDGRGIGDNIESVAEQRPADSESDGTSEQHRPVEEETTVTGDVDTSRQSERGTADSRSEDSRNEAKVGAGELTENDGGTSDGKTDILRGNRRGRSQIHSNGEGTVEGGQGVRLPSESSTEDISGRRSEAEIYTEDNENRELSKEVAEQLKNSVILDYDERPIAVYHFTKEDFDRFKIGDIGFHFGNYEQATNKSAGTDGRMVRAYLNIQNPIYARLDLMCWKVDHLSLYLYSEGILTDTEFNTIQSMIPKGVRYDSPASIELRQVLGQKGYDGIVYPNGYEGEGYSYIAFYDEQIIGRESIKFTNRSETDTPKLTDKCELYSTKHTSTGDDIWVVTLKDKLSAEDYKELSAKVKSVGGYYSHFAKTPDGKAIPGFVFKTEPTANELNVFNDFFAGTEAQNVSKAKNARITKNMSDSERYEILKDKIISDIPSVDNLPQNVIESIKNDEKIGNISSWEDINDYFGSKKRTLIQKIASEFGVFKDYNNSDINIEFTFSKNDYRESYGKQKHNFESFAKMFSAFDKVVENAIGIEVHNRNDEGYKPDVTLKNSYVLISAFSDGDLIYPVKLEVKEFSDKKNSLYVAISLEAIKKTEVSKQGTTENGVAQNSRSVDISIQDIFKNVNISDIDFLKYIPNQFLTDEQNEAKNKALEEEKEKYSHKKTETPPQDAQNNPKSSENVSGEEIPAQTQKVATEQNTSNTEAKASSSKKANAKKALKTDGFLHEKEQTEKKPKEIRYSISDNTYQAKNLSEESEDSTNESERDNLLSGDSRRAGNESAGEQAEGLSEAERKRTAEEILSKGQTEQKVVKNVQIALVKEEAYNDDMRSIVDSNKARGLNTHFFLGNGNYKWDTKKQLVVDGMVNGRDIYLQYDGKFSPQTLNRHENVHDSWDTEETQKVANEIWNSLSEAEKKEILSRERYEQYAELYDGDIERVKQEFIADVLAGMSTYSSQFAELANSYWSNNEANLDNFKVSEYTHSTDAGGISNEKISTNNQRGIDRISGEGRNSSRGNTGDTEDIHNGRPTRKSEADDRTKDERWRNGEGSNRYDLEKSTLRSASEDDSRRSESDERRYLEALSNNEEDVARELLNKQAEQNGYETVYVYHGTLSDKPFDSFKSGGAIWVTENKKYASDFAGGFSDEITLLDHLFTESNSGIYELFVKKGKVLDLGDINRDLTSPEELLEFGNQIGFSTNEILRCWNAGRTHEQHTIWTLSVTPEFADIARKHGYDSLRATEHDGIETFGILYPNNLKSSKLITYDDDGNIIPLSQRFDDSKNSMRYSFSTKKTIESVDAGGNSNNLSESGELNGYEQNHTSGKLGRLENSSKIERYTRVGKMGYSQPEEQNTPHTKSVHRSGVSAEAITSSDLTAQQAMLKEENKIYGNDTEFFIKATQNGVEKSSLFTTENTVYYPNSAFQENDIVVKNRIASFTEKRFDDLIETFSVPVGGTLNKDYAKGYVAYMSPSDFLSLTAVNEQKIINDTKTNSKYGNGKLDVDILSNTAQTPFLEIDFDNGEITAHEGRHRMVMLRDAGIERVAIVIRDIDSERNKYRTKKMSDVSVTGQEFNNGTAPGKVIIREIIPLSPNYRDEVRAKFVDTASDIHYSLSTKETIESVDADVYTTEATAWDEALEKYGAIQKGEIPSRDIDVPRNRSSTEPISWFGRTALEAGITPNEVVDDFQREIMFGRMAHEVITDKKAEEDAIAKIKGLGFEGAVNNWNELFRSDKINKKDFVFGMVLYNQAVTNKDYKLAMKLISDLTVVSSESAQVLQSVRMLKKMSPDGTLYYLEKSVEKMNKEFMEQLGDKFDGIEIDPDLMRELYEAETADERDEAIEKIEQNIADQIPSTLLDKWNAWRYLAMLGNVRTHGRNIWGNMSFWSARKVKNLLGAVMEKAIPVEKRTKSVVKSKEAVAFAKDDAKAMMDILTGTGGKYEMANKIQQKRTIFKTKWLELIRRKNFDFLEAEDWWFLSDAYADSLAQLITARKIDVDSLKANTSEANDLLNKIRAYAINEAKVATFRQMSELGNLINKTKRELSKSKNIGKKTTGILLEGVLPFTNVPINIAKQGVAFSPLGLGKGIYEALHDVKKGNKTASEAIDSLSKGLTGTAIVGFGMLLSSLGWIVVEPDDDEKKKEYDKMKGHQSYALQIGEHSYTIDWLTPISLPLFVGVELHNLTKEDGTSVEDMINALSRIVDPMVELSVLQGVSDALYNAKYTEESPFVTVPMGMLTSYLGQALPTIGGQIARLVDDKQRKVYVEKGEGFLTRQIKSFIQTMAKKIPFASMLLEPQIDAWGKEKTYGSVVERIAESTISPGYYSKITTDEIDEELHKLFEATGDNSVYPPSNTVKSLTKNKKTYNLNAEQSREYAEERGKISREKIQKLLKVKGFQNLSDEKKVEWIKKAYDKAHADARDHIIKKYFTE